MKLEGHHETSKLSSPLPLSLYADTPAPWLLLRVIRETERVI